MNAPSLKIQERLLWAGVLFVFVAGFFILHGREAATSKSWRYAVIRHDDEYGYWSTAKGAAETPRSDGNPFFYEDRGQRNTIPYTTAEWTGLIARFLHIPVMAFFPVWHIGMPFFLWLCLYLCLKKIWRYPPIPSGAIALLILLSTLFLRGQTQLILYRFSRPGDGIGFIIIMLSLIMHLDEKPRARTLLAAFTGALLLWLQAFYACLPLCAAAGEAVWQFFFKKNKKYAACLAGIVLAVVLSGVSQFLYVKANLDQNPWVLDVVKYDGLLARRFIHWPSIGLFGALALFTAALGLYFRKGPSKLDRLLLFVFFMHPLTMHLRLLFPSTHHFSTHRYYFFIIEMAVLTGWLMEKIPLLMEKDFFKRWGWGAAALCLAGGLYLWNSPFNFFLHQAFFAKESSYHGPVLMYGVPPSSRFDFDNTLLWIGLFPWLYLCVWAYHRFPKIKALLHHRAAALTILLATALCGYGFLPSQLAESNRDFPFEGAYQWFQKHADKNEVVLTAVPSRYWILEDYLIPYTDLKIYYKTGYFGGRISRDPEASAYRKMFYTALLLGHLREIPIGPCQTIEEKLTHLRLDYILTNYPSPFTGRIEAQLAGHITVVYKDEKSLIWKVNGE